jgi:hypothetical protein
MQQKTPLHVASHSHPIAEVLQVENLRRSDYFMQRGPPQMLGLRHQRRDDQVDGAIKAKIHEETIMEMPAKKTPASFSEIVKLIRKLRWIGLDEKAEQLEKELERHDAATDTVVSIQSETD